MVTFSLEQPCDDDDEKSFVQFNQDSDVGQIPSWECLDQERWDQTTNNPRSENEEKEKLRDIQLLEYVMHAAGAALSQKSAKGQKYAW